VVKSTFYEVFRATRGYIDSLWKLPGLPETYCGLKKLAVDFQRTRSPPSPLPGCAGALDGICIKIRKPDNYQLPVTYYCREGFYVLPVQALVDSSYRFRCFSALCRGSTHDSFAHAVSALGRYLEEGKLDGEFWIAGDEAYICTESLITPVPSTQAKDAEYSLTFHHSSLRMHIEQAFDMLVFKWALLKSLQFGVDESAESVSVAMKMFNFCIDHGAAPDVPKGDMSDEEMKFIDDSLKWYEEGKLQNLEQFGRRIFRRVG